MVQDYFCLCPASLYTVIHIRNFESHVHFPDWCATVKISSSEDYSALLALQFQEVGVRRVLPDGTGIRLFETSG
jgi:hypothetical protein